MRSIFTLLALVVVILLGAIPIQAQTTIYNGQFYGTGMLTRNATIATTVHNRSGGSLALGDLVIWRRDSITVTQFGTPVAGVCHGVAGVGDSSFSIDPVGATGDSGLSSMAGQFLLVIQSKGTAVTDTLFIMGRGTSRTDYSASPSWVTPTKDTIVMLGGTDSVYVSDKRWTRADSFRVKRGGSGFDSLRVRACDYLAVTTTTSGADVRVAGVISETITNNSWGRMIIQGPAFCKILPGGVFWPGTYVETSATAKYAQPNGTPAVGKGFGKLLEPTGAGSGSDLHRVWVTLGY